MIWNQGALGGGEPLMGVLQIGALESRRSLLVQDGKQEKRWLFMRTGWGTEVEGKAIQYKRRKGFQEESILYFCHRP